MWIAVVRFRLSQPMSRDEARAIYLQTAPRYLDVPGLVRKAYLLSEDGLTAGGLYCWHSRAEAEATYTGQWREFVTAKYGVPPEIEWFDSPVQIDVARQEIATR